MLKTTTKYALLTFITAALVVGGYAYWQHEQRYPSTDDAYIQAHVITIAPQVNGDVAQIFVHNQQHVKKNQLLFTIDPKPFQIAYEKAQANLQNAQQQVQVLQHAVNAAQATLLERQAQLADAQKDSDRIMPLVKQGYYAKTGGDAITSKLNVAKQSVIAAQNELSEAKENLGKIGDNNAQIKLAKTALEQAALNLAYTNIMAPTDGELAQFTLRPGQTVTAYQGLFSLIGDNTWWVMANMKETNLNRIRVGQKATIYVDLYPSHSFHGIVKSISPGSGSSFDLLPAENATGNWVKVTQRFPVKIAITDLDPHYPLRIGASCSVVIDTK